MERSPFILLSQNANIRYVLSSHLSAAEFCGTFHRREQNELAKKQLYHSRLDRQGRQETVMLTSPRNCNDDLSKKLFHVVRQDTVICGPRRSCTSWAFKKLYVACSMWTTKTVPHWPPSGHHERNCVLLVAYKLYHEGRQQTISNRAQKIVPCGPPINCIK
jgi:hypothetical protein